MALAIFDLDNTLIAGDSDYLWGQFLVDQGIVDRDVYEAANAHFYEEYKQGRLDIAEFLAFALQPLAAHEPEQLRAWRAAFVRDKIQPLLLPAARSLIDQHRAAGDTLMIITATNRFVTEPIAALYGIEELIATTPELREGRYTGRYEGTPCFQSGKVTRLREWLDRHDQDLAGSWFYSDSHNDLPLLESVSHPVAVDPDEILDRHARQHGWTVLTLREGACPDQHLERVAQRPQPFRIK
jgi:HAD superfamily hydrolase (TIGR01490 family)